MIKATKAPIKTEGFLWPFLLEEELVAKLTSSKEEYRNLVLRRVYLSALLFLSLILLGLYALRHGAYGLSLSAIWESLFSDVESPTQTVILQIRLPRILASLLCGAGLGLSGLVIQTLLKNPLASPSTLGISQGAAFGAALGMVLFGKGLSIAALFAFLGGMSATFVIIILSSVKRLSPEAIVLSGVAWSSLFVSGTTLIQYLSTETQLAGVVFWTFGDVARSTWKEIMTIAVTLVALILYFIKIRWDLNALAQGDEVAASLGVPPKRVRILGMFLATLLAALITAFHGVIAFVGLLCPHMARRLVGNEHGILIPMTLIMGALLLLAADTTGRLLVGSGALPVGVVTSFLGAPLFLWLLVRGKRW